VLQRPEQQSLNLHSESPADRAFIQQLKAFNAFGTSTVVPTLDGINYYINEFWTARQRQASRLHEVSYRACFKPQLPRFFIERLTVAGDVVYDPFMGRGTTPLEAALLGRVPYGNDTNPLSRALLQPRLNPPALAAIEERLRSIPWNSFSKASSQDLLTFYHPETLAHIEGLRDWLLAREASGELDAVDQWIRMVAINRLTGHSSGFFSVYTLPPNQAVTVARQKLINEKRQQTPPCRDVAAIILKKTKSLLSQEHPRCNESLLCTAQSSHTPQIPDASVQLTVTSPPFLDVVDYEGDNWLRCWFLGVDPKAVNIASHKKVADWQNFIRATLVELARITKPGGTIAFEVGEVRKGTIQLEQNVVKAAEGLPIHPLGVLINQQDFTKTANCWGVSNNQAGTNSNRIVLLRRNP
jgi:hypothetical protein